MALSPVSQDERLWRLKRIASEWGIEDFNEEAPLARPSVSPVSPAFKSPNDDSVADDILKRRRASSLQSQNGGGVKKAFSLSRKSSFATKEIYDALDSHVTSAGNPGVAEALIEKLRLAGGDVNSPNVKTRPTFNVRRKSSTENFERSKILQTAIANGQIDMVSVLIPHADPFTLDAALPKALRSGNIKIVELLLQYGANVSQTPDGQDAFRQMCITGSQEDLVGLVLRSGGRPAPSFLSEAMIDAARKGCTGTVMRLSRSTADASFKHAEALKEAVSQCRVDVGLALLTGSNPPNLQGLNEAFSKLFTHPTIMPNEKIAFAEILLCAGAEGDVVSAALVQACTTQFYEMIDLLLGYGASIEFERAMVVRDAIEKHNTSLVQILLSEKTALSPAIASDLVQNIPKRISSDERQIFLSILLRRGATGQALDDALIDAVENRDVDCVKLLLTPHFSGSGKLQPKASHNLKKGPRSMVFERHAMADVNYKAGLALQLAVLSGNLSMVEFILAAKPSKETLVQVFPSIAQLPPNDRYHMAESLLSAGVSGPCVHSALQAAIDEVPPQRDERLIRLLLQHDGDSSINDAAPITSAIEHVDVDLLGALLKRRPTEKNAAKALAQAMTVDDHNKRVQMVSLLLEAGAASAVKTVGEALIKVLQQTPTDLRLLDVLLKQGKADINLNNGDPAVLAVRNEDPRVLELVLQTGQPSAETVDLAVQAMANLASTQEKAAKLDSILKRTKHKDSLNSLLVTEVQAILRSKPGERVLTTLKQLLAAGVDVNAHKAAGLCHAVGAADSELTDILLATKPSTASLGAAMPHALKISDPMDRLTYTQRLLQAGAPALEANRALVFAIGALPNDFPLLNTLVPKADTTDGEALMAAVKKERPDLVELILGKSRRKYTIPALNGAFVAAASIQNKDTDIRKAICELLLKAGASGECVSQALLAAANSGDLKFGAILMEHGASVDHSDGQAIVEACKSGSSDVLKMLLLNEEVKVKKQTLERGFQAATEIGDLKARGAVFHILLEKGVTGHVVDAQLVSAARFGDDAIDLVRLLLQYGAETDYNSGEAVWNATRCAFMGILEMMIGVVKVGGKQRIPSKKTLVRAMKASWRLSGQTRYQVMDWLFTAGLPVGEEIHLALNKSVNEDEPNIQLVHLLLNKGASPFSDGCRTFVDAARKLLFPALDLFLQLNISAKDMTWAFSETFKPDEADRWMSEDGFKVAQRLLENGAEGGGLSAALIVAIDRLGTEKDDIARRFIDLLIQHNADVNQGGGEAMVRAAKSANTHLIQQVLQRKPNSASVSMAFPYIFDHELPEDQMLELITLFTDYHDGEERLDAMFTHPESSAVMFRAISRYPRSTKILQTLLDVGYYHDQMGTARIFNEIAEEEAVNLLLWTLLQPQKKVSSALITLLVDKGAKVNFETKASKTTPLVQAVKERRQDIVQALILAGAEVDVADVTGNTPLTLATQIYGDLGTSMMSNILAAEPSKNDGSLHNAARGLNIRAMQVLIEFGHDVDFPSPLHGGRSALGELCLHASDSGALTAAQEKAMEKAMAFLMEKGTDLSVLSHGKSVLLLAMESFDPVPTTKALLKVGMWKHINNRAFNHYSDGSYTYSPTVYASRVLPQTDTTRELYTLLKANRSQDVFYANEGPQPEGACGLPEDIIRAERERKARLERVALEAEDHERTLARTKEVADIHNQIFASRAQLEDIKAKRQRDQEINGIRERAKVEEDLFADAVRRQKAERQAAMEHTERLTNVELNKTRLIAETEFEVEGRKQMQMLQWEQQINREKVDSARQMSAVRVSEREEIERFDRDHDGRIRARIGEQKKLVDSQNQLATNLGGVGLPARRQVGYISGELN